MMAFVRVFSVCMLVISAFAGGLVAGASLLGGMSPDSLRQDENKFGRLAALVSLNDTRVVAEVAEDRETRARGLSGRAALPDGRGMLFVFESPGRYGIWMRNMQFSIDIIWMRDGRVVDVARSVPAPAPNTPEFTLPVYEPREEASHVLEAPAGFVQKHNIAVGSLVRVEFDTETELIERQRTLERAGLPGAEYFIERLRASPERGTNFRVAGLLTNAGAYKKYQVYYDVGGLTLSGVMNVPNVSPPATGFPVLILNHGLISKSIYYSGRGSRREQDFFARHGYITLHPDYRGLGLSDPNPVEHHDFYVGYTVDVMAAVDAVKEAGLDFVDETRLGIWGHSMGGGIAARVMVLRPNIRAYVLFAPISANTFENFYELPRNEVAWLKTTYGESPEASPSYDLISPITYFGDVDAPVQLHHGTADGDVPIKFSENMHATLRALGKDAEFYVYPGEKHEFISQWQVAANRALDFFDEHVKNL